ncbi:hypothetical protein PRIPAC_91235 [Pristionchus pacificus]|uniref:AAA protein n=1 Tax=Pristionchus pacificus TaxID=54126 RepID=A0A2A6CJ14_PRIPA|nr:hypothetical protein PRIPAC_91235 [Pristionchus pacificus]|eukprot:PDM78119.1 AAA protein [Pristionchus pacificus]
MERSLSTELLVENDENQREESWLSRFLHLIYKSDGDDDEGFSSVKPVSFLQLFRFASRKEKLAIGIAIFLSVIIGMCTPAHIYLCGVITTLYVDVKEPKGNLEFLHHIWRLSSVYGVFFVFTFIFGYIENWLHVWASERIAQRVRSEFISSVLSREIFNEDGASTGELSNRLNSNIDRLKDGIGDNIGTFVRSISMFISGSMLSFYLDWRTSLLLIWSGPICLLNSSLIPLLSSSANNKVVRLSEEANGISEEAILNIKTVASCNGEKSMIEVNLSLLSSFFPSLLQRYSSSLLSSIAPSTRCGFVTALCDATASLVHAVFHTAGLWYGTISYHCGRIEGAGSVFAVVSVAMGSASCFTRLGPHLMAVVKARAAAAKVYHTIDSRPREEELLEKIDPSNAEMNIRFENVSYTFPTRCQLVLQNISFNLSPGESIALVGKSGCGKSTTLKLVTRFLSYDTGRIILDGRPIERYDKKRWRRMVGVVSQEPSLFNGSIRDNICLGRPFSEEEVQRACKIAYAHHFIMGLDEGYSTLLGPSGVSLSGGQKQRIAIARAIVSNPRLLLLDEATSALDTKSERIVQEALDSASEGRTTIVVAHRLSTIKNVNRVIVMDEGRIVETGGYDELRCRPEGIFAQMISAQENERMEEQRVTMMDKGETEIDDIVKHKESVDEINPNQFPITIGGVFSLYFYNKKRAFFTTILSLLRGIEMPLLAASFYFVFTSLKDTEYETELFWTMIGTLFVGAFSFTIIIISQTVHTYTGESTMKDLRISCFSSLLHRPMEYFDRQETSPSASSVLLSQQPPIAMAIVHNSMSNMIENVFAGFIIAGMTFFICIPNGLIGIAYLIIFFTTFALVEHYSNKAYNEVVEIDKSGELAMEIFDNVSTIQQLAVESHFQDRFDEIQMRRRKPLALKIRCLSMVHAINESESLLLDFMATTIGIYFVYTGLIDIKQMYATEFFIAILGYCAIAMSESFKDIVLASSAARLLFKLIDPTIEKKEESENSGHMMLNGSIRADFISFSYPSRPHKRILNDITFSVGEGRSIALVGPSGGGKSTVVNLIERFYQPTQGEIYLSDIPFPSIPSSSLRSTIALVSQEPILFRGNIMDNIRLGVENASEEDVIEACRMANAHEFIRNFPEGYSTPVGEKGRSLSGGQKQRIAIARALVRNPRLIVLDEATSALDTQSEQVVREALLTSARGRTSVTIAHRLDTIRHCDEICLIEGGRIVERGGHEELMERRGKYAEMVDQQRLT